MADFKDLKAKIDLVTVLTQRGLKLTPKGVNLFALCPFPDHQEDTPSFCVDPRRQLWSCFGCGRGGDVFTFVMEVDGCSFVQAVKKLCKNEIHAKDLEELKSQRQAQDARQPIAVDLVSAEWMFRHWRERLAESNPAQQYLKARGLWRPDVLRSFQVGFSSGDLPRSLPAEDPKLRRLLRDTHILNTRGNEFFFQRITIPVFDEAGALANIYGRAIDTGSEVPHLYLPRPRRGVFNGAALGRAESVIVSESILDALSLIVLGFPHTTASYGVRGFTADHLALIQQAKIRRVYCAYDADTAGDDGAAHLTQYLGAHGIEVLRVRLPVKDANELLKSGATAKAFQALLDQARPIDAGGKLVPAHPPHAVVASPVDATPAATMSDPTGAAGPGGTFRVQQDSRTYDVTALPGQNALTLRVRLRVRHGTKNFVDILNLYSDRARTVAVTRLAKVFGAAARADQIEADLFGIIDRLERAARSDDAEASAPGEEMSSAAKEEAETFLKRPDLADRIRADIAELGVVGEEQAKLLVYLVATSRKLAKPLSIAVVSRSSAGKSFLVMRTAELMPPEEVLAYTRLSAKALFHDDSDRLRHKLLMVEEAQGMEEAAYALRVMQSSQMLKNLSTITDPTTGRHKAQENVVYGPVALVVTTTRELDFETVSRAFVISVDESVEQTARIHELQRLARTLDGLKHQAHREVIVRTHQNAQRLLMPLRVVNDFAPYLTFPTGTLRLRREQEKYLTLIEAISFLFQLQREQGVYGQGQTAIPYVKTAAVDIDLANRLVVSSLRQAFEEITTPSRELLAAIRRLVTERGGGEASTDVRFSRRELREFTRWSDYQVRIHLKQLEELEYVQAVSGSFGKQYVYMLSPDHRLAITGEAAIEEQIRELGLTSGAEAAAKMAKARKPHRTRP